MNVIEQQAIDESRADVLLTARAECFLVGHPHPLQESVRRLQAYAEAGADVLFAPGVHEPADVKAIVEAVRQKPFNLLVARDSGLNVADIAALGVRRISVSPALALAAWTGFRQAAQVLKSEGRFAGFANLVPYSDINESFTADSGARSGSWQLPVNGGPWMRLDGCRGVNASWRPRAAGGRNRPRPVSPRSADCCERLRESSSQQSSRVRHLLQRPAAAGARRHRAM